MWKCDFKMQAFKVAIVEMPHSLIVVGFAPCIAGRAIKDRKIH